MINNVTDTLWSDVSEWQAPVNDSYSDAGYRVLAIRSNDGDYFDRNWAQNYDWCWHACDSGKLVFFIVYLVYRPNWVDALNALKQQVNAPHPKMVVMIDVESWPDAYGNPAIFGNNSESINKLWWGISDWLGAPSIPSPRVIGYANEGDFNSLWPDRPPGLRVVGAGYGSNPNLPGQIAHQYTNGEGYGGGLPEGAPPWSHCDMNSADGLSVEQLADTLGVGGGPPPPSSPAPAWDLPTDDSIYEAADVIIGQFMGAS